MKKRVISRTDWGNDEIKTVFINSVIILLDLSSEEFLLIRICIVFLYFFLFVWLDFFLETLKCCVTQTTFYRNIKPRYKLQFTTFKRSLKWHTIVTMKKHRFTKKTRKVNLFQKWFIKPVSLHMNQINWINSAWPSRHLRSRKICLLVIKIAMNVNFENNMLRYLISVTSTILILLCSFFLNISRLNR